jgi:hypothetical protein
MQPAATAPPAPTSAIATEAEAAAVVNELGRLMTELTEIVGQETELVRAGRLTSAAKVADRKSELARAFLHTASRVRAGTRHLAHTMPQLLDALRAQHEQFRAKLQTNLTVLATARAVSEGILRGVSNEMARRRTVQTYGASGRHQTQTRRPATPIALSRSL